MRHRKSQRDTERDRETQRDRERHRDSDSKRQSDRATERQSDRATERHRGSDRAIERARESTSKESPPSHHPHPHPPHTPCIRPSPFPAALATQSAPPGPTTTPPAGWSAWAPRTPPGSPPHLGRTRWCRWSWGGGGQAGALYPGGYPSHHPPFLQTGTGRGSCAGYWVRQLGNTRSQVHVHHDGSLHVCTCTCTVHAKAPHSTHAPMQTWTKRPSRVGCGVGAQMCDWPDDTLSGWRSEECLHPRRTDVHACYAINTKHTHSQSNMAPTNNNTHPRTTTRPSTATRPRPAHTCLCGACSGAPPSPRLHHWG